MYVWYSLWHISSDRSKEKEKSDLGAIAISGIQAVNQPKRRSYTTGTAWIIILQSCLRNNQKTHLKISYLSSERHHQ